MDSDFHFDVVRTFILSKYICNWGCPRERIVTSKNGRHPVELYIFPGDESSKIIRFATVGVSEQEDDNGKRISSHEMLLVLPKNLGGAKESEVTNFLLDIMAYSLRSDVAFVPENTIPGSTLAPAIWREKSLLLEEPHGEEEELKKFVIDGNEIKLIWVIPIYDQEEKKIQAEGLKWFDQAREELDLSLINLARSSFS